VVILLADGARDDDLGYGSFGSLVHSSPFSSVSSAGNSGRSGNQHSQSSMLLCLVPYALRMTQDFALGSHTAV